MTVSIKSQTVGFVIGVKATYLIIFLEENKIGILSKQYFKKKRFFIGQLIIGKFETQASSSIRFKITKKLKLNSFSKIHKFYWPFNQILVRIPKNITIKAIGLCNFDVLLKKIGKFFEFNSACGTNGLISYTTNEKFVNQFFIIKIKYQKYVSL
jgi:hypothetical protein|mmetsp:Transcript_59173/g.95642  ORF Transcript_59173/g.95642 Transcript_59173/m.95642 type:complete len:154 (-) Transcript_59173:4020-4481(-)